MTLNLICLAIALVSTAVALVLVTRRAKLTTPTKVMFGLTLLSTAVAIVLTVLAA